MNYSVYYSDPAETASKGFGRVAHLPCIFDRRPGYHRLGSEYLIDRGLGLWHPALPRTGQPTSPPAAKTIDNYAHWLANFLEWAEHRGVALGDCSYHSDVRGRYQEELLRGTWSRDGCGLSPTTVNLYVDVACDFLTWLAHKGYRPAFAIPTRTVVTGRASATNSRGHRAVSVEVREGKVRQNKARLRMPSDEEVRRWLEAVYERSGPTMGLMCEAVLMTATRRAEAAAFRVDTIPLDSANWHISNPTAPLSDRLIRVELKFGTKGHGTQTDHDDKIGPPRHILLPLVLAQRIDDYRRDVRPKQVLRWVKAARGATLQRERLAGAVHLFRDARTGDRITARALYDAWTGVPLPFDGWSPHLGRDWWACSTLWREVKQFEAMSKQQRTSQSHDITRFATDVIRLKIQPQLGHRDESTSHRYLLWAMDMLGVALPQQYLGFLEGEQVEPV